MTDRGDRIRRSTTRLLLALFWLSAAACSGDATGPALPPMIHACETNTARVCGTWTLQGTTNTYLAEWPQGSRAVITVIRFDATAVEFSREDTAGPTSDMVAHYTGTPDGQAVLDGHVVWTTGGLTFSGGWDAEW